MGDKEKGPILPRITPTLCVPDVEAACRFYTEKLGFEFGWTWDDPPSHASVIMGEAEIHLASGKPAADQGAYLYLAVNDADGMYKACLGAGVELSGEPEDKPWDMREFTMWDPNGYKIRIGGRPSG